MKPRTRNILLAYLALLVASNAVRLAMPDPVAPAAGQSVFETNTIDNGDPAAGNVRISYRDTGRADGPAVLLLHGTPVASNAMMPFARELERDFRVITPDLPGFGRSTLRLPDYSFRTHAVYVTRLLDHLALDDAHVVAYSQGGGAALWLAELTPDRVRSLTLASSIGVQELELLGDYRMNQALYAVQLWGLRGIMWLTPHFGYFDDAILSVAYARNLTDSDQRPLRGILSRTELPVLILHGRDDKLVPLAAAEEHHRLVPQSALRLFDGGHILIITDPATFAAPLRSFIRDVERGAAPVRADATAERLARADAPFDWSHVPAFEGITLVIILVLLAFATYVSEDLACISAGLMVARGMLDFVPATAACMAGIYTGDLLLFLAGRFAGPAALERAPLRWLVKPDTLARSRAWFDRRGPAVIFASRFIPGMRLGTYLIAGALRMSFARFSLYFLLAAAVWTPLLVGVAFLIGTSVFEFLEAYQRYSLIVAVALVIVLWIVLKLVVPAFSFRGRRLLLSKWRRRTRWEFWPMWAFYPPLVLYVLWLGLRHRSLTLFTASNPAIPASGFIGESKSEILDGLADAGDRIARFRMLEAGTPAARLEAVREFMAQHGLDYPVVIKPDVGERGAGVLIARDEGAAAEYLASTRGRLLVQEFAPGQEFGVFYYRLPGEPSGHIFAVTDKRPPVVTGDGRRTLEELILADDRAVCMADTFMNRHIDRLYDVPQAGEEIALVDVGTHCMGCLFLDGGWVVTPEMEAEIDRVSKLFDGFYFGRYDIRTPDIEAFRRGEDYKIVELNGVTSEATNIYDPKNSLVEAYRILAQQWRIAFRIGAANRARGTEPVSVMTLLKVLRQIRRDAAAA